MRLWPLLLLLLLTGESCWSLRLVQLRVPVHKLQAGTATLRCLFDLQGSTLYSVQWYRDGAEFYRYMPQDKPPAQIFPLPGVTLEQSDETRVVLRLLTLESSGMYRCEVSTEAPTFLTVAAQAHMLVMALPRESPRLSGLAEVYSQGEPVEVNCTSARSKPAAALAWFVNEQEAGQLVKAGSSSGPWQTHYRVEQGEDRLELVTLGLRLAAHPRFFPEAANHVLRLRCTATLGALQWHVQQNALLIPKAAAVTHFHSSHLLLLILLLHCICNSLYCL